jgi:glyoxylase-like metal-dependent hydrolase (beta-lactamase superfamily II)
LLGDPPAVVVIDPGPDDDAHLDAIHRALGGAAVGVVLVTHSHADHLELAPRFAAMHRARLARFPELADGDVVSPSRPCTPPDTRPTTWPSGYRRTASSSPVT